MGSTAPSGKRASAFKIDAEVGLLRTQPPMFSEIKTQSEPSKTPNACSALARRTAVEGPVSARQLSQSRPCTRTLVGGVEAPRAKSWVQVPEGAAQTQPFLPQTARPGQGLAEDLVHPGPGPLLHVHLCIARDHCPAASGHVRQQPCAQRGRPQGSRGA